MAIGKLPEKEFRIMIVKTIQDLRKKNGEDAKNVYQRPKRTKEWSNRDKQYTRINQ